MPEFDSGLEFRDVVGFPGYKVGNDGSVWTCSRKKGLGRGRGFQVIFSGGHWRQLRNSTNDSGHLVVALAGGGLRRQILVHRLVLKAFVGPCPPGMECRHFPDPNPTNNRLDNLQWGTRSENIADRTIHGTTYAVGEKNGKAKLTAEVVLSIRAKAAAGASVLDVAEEYGLSRGYAYKVIHRWHWKHI